MTSRNFSVKAGIRSLFVASVMGLLCLMLDTSLYAEEAQVESTRILIHTSGPVAYRHLYHSSPPRITFRFLQNTVYSSIQESVSIQKGIVKEIEATYFKKSPIPGGKKPLKTLTFHLLADTTYEVFETPQSLLLVIRHPEGFPEDEWVTGKVMLTAFPAVSFQPGKRQEEMASALQKAMAKIAPKEEIPVVGEAESAEEEIETPLGPMGGAMIPKAEPLQEAPVVEPPVVPEALTPQVSQMIWYKSPYFFYGIVLFFILGGLFWPPSWFSLQNRVLRREKTRGWEMAKRLIALKEESVSREGQFAKEIASREEEKSLLQSKLALLHDSNLNLQEEAKALAVDKERQKKELDRAGGALHELARERIELAEHIQAVQSELQELSVRHDQEISRRRELEEALEGQKKKEVPSGELGAEKRRWTRLPILTLEKQDLPLTVEVQGPEGRIIYGYPRDVSMGGISFELKERVDLPSPLSFTLFFPNRKSSLDLQGKIVWKLEKGSSSCYGVRFMELPQGASEALNQFVKERFFLIQDSGRRLAEEILKQKTDGKMIRFICQAPSAGSVFLVGDFNGWDVQAHPMRKLKNGTWKIVFALPPGTYQYQFLIDGTWCADPKADTRVPNAFGTENSVIEVS